MKRLVVVVASVAVPVGSGASAAFAGEVKGPPNQLNNTYETGALDHANSACATSGLNDFDLSDPMGHTVSQVQTAADSWKYYGLPKGGRGSSASAGAHPGRGKKSCWSRPRAGATLLLPPVGSGQPSPRRSAAMREVRQHLGRRHGQRRASPHSISWSCRSRPPITTRAI